MGVLLVVVVAALFLAPPGFFQNALSTIYQQTTGNQSAQEQVETLAQQALPTIVAKLQQSPAPAAPPPAPADGSGGAPPPAGAQEFTLTEQQANESLLTGVSLEPLEHVTIHFVPGEVHLDLVAYGISGQVTCSLAVQDGRVVIINPQIHGPLSVGLAVDDLAATIEQQINDEISAQGITVHGVRIEQQAIVFLVE
jgi:hypothetical protein